MEYSYRRLFSFFRQFLQPYWGRYTVATFLAIIASGIGLYNAYAVASIVNFLIAHKSGEPLTHLYFVLISWCIAIAIRYITGTLSKYIGMTTAERSAKDSELFVINHLSLLDIGWHEKENTGNKLKKIDRGAQNIIDMTRLWLSSIIDIAVNGLGALIIIYHFDSKLAFFLALYLIVYFFIARTTRSRAIKALKIVNIKDEEITGLFYEITANIRTIKVLGMASKIMEFAAIAAKDYYEKAKRRVFWFQFGTLSRGLWDALSRVLLFGFVIFNILHGHYEVGFLVLFYGYFNNVTNSVNNLSDVTQELATYKVNIGRMTDILDEKIVIDLDTDKQDFPKDWESIKIKNLSFNYGENNVLSDINLEVKRGEKIGIVGLSGAGKSTLFKLLLKEYENYEGEILIGNVPLRKIKKTSYIKHMAAVLQETEVFNMSLKQNIALANAEQSENEELLEHSMMIAHVHDFIPKLAQGIETLIGEKGVKLSGGERQRLGIARAVFKTPEILFLDEATSHLDIESEQKIQDSLKKFFKDVTAVVIAHRLSTIREMDRIIVIEAGKIIESGTFDELHAKSGRFREFWDKQRK